MIRFKCPDCSAGLRVDDAKAGKLTACPSCGKTVRAPARSPADPEIVEELPVVEDEEEDEEVLDAVAADDDEGRRRKRRRKMERPPPPEDEEPGGRDFMTRNRLMGLVGIVFGVALSIAVFMMSVTGRVDLRNYLANAYNCGGCLSFILAVLLIVVGIIYAIRG